MNITITKAIPQSISVQPPQFRSTQITALQAPQLQSQSMRSMMITAPLLPLVELGMIGIPGPQGPPGPPSDQITVSDTPPSSPEINDLWVDTA